MLLNQPKRLISTVWSAAATSQRKIPLTSAVPSKLNLASWILRPLCKSLTKHVLTGRNQTAPINQYSKIREHKTTESSEPRH